MKKEYNNLKNLLETEVDWPSRYDFKFIVKTERKDQLCQKLENFKISIKESKKGTYTSVTATKTVKDADSVISVYQELSDFEGLITL